jgi:hypothetical protein
MEGPERLGRMFPRGSVLASVRRCREASTRHIDSTSYADVNAREGELVTVASYK